MGWGEKSRRTGVSSLVVGGGGGGEEKEKKRKNGDSEIIMMITSFGSFVVSQRPWYDERCHPCYCHTKRGLVGGWVNESNRMSKRSARVPLQ